MTATDTSVNAFYSSILLSQMHTIFTDFLPSSLCWENEPLVECLLVRCLSFRRQEGR